MMRIHPRLALVMSLLGALAAVPGAGAVLANDNLHGGTTSFSSTIDCSGDPYLITATYNQAVHMKDGRFRLTQTGSFAALPVDEGQTASGRYTFSLGEVANPDGSVTGRDAFSLTGKYADGTPLSFHYQEQWKDATPTSILKYRFHSVCPG